MAKLPKADRKAAIFFVARKTGRIIEPLSTKERNSEAAKQLAILSVTCLAWLVFVGIGAARHDYSFNVNGFLLKGVIPTLVPWITFLVYKYYLTRSSRIN